MIQKAFVEKFLLASSHDLWPREHLGNVMLEGDDLYGEDPSA
jgi:hypothetical protein